jgi:hypothetical protein
VRRLPEPDRLRAWLFALARNECHRRLRGAAPSSRLYEAAQAMDDTGSIAISEQAEFRALVRAALAGLDPEDREISELNVRHGFYGADLADILGVPRKRAHVLAARARSRFERSLGVLPVAGWKQCPELKAVLDSQDRSSSPGLSPQVRRHIRGCALCRQRQRIGLNPAVLLGLLPVNSVPAGLRRQVMDLITDEPAPGGVAYRDRLAARTERFDARGFPVQATAVSARGWRVTSFAAAAAAIAALALLGGAMYYAGHLFAQGGPAPAVTGRSPQPSPSKHPPSAGVRARSSGPRNGSGTANVAGQSSLSKRPGTKSARSRVSGVPSSRPSALRSARPSSLPVPLPSASVPVPLPSASLPIALPLS